MKYTPRRVAYHTPCHMESLGLTACRLKLLRQIPGLYVVVLASQCCGIAGTCGFESDNFAMARGIGCYSVKLRGAGWIWW